MSPWQRIHIDYAGPFLGQMFLIVVDAHSKWPEVVGTKSSNSSHTIDILRAIFASNGVPEQIVSDNTPQFTSDEFQMFLKRNVVKHITSSPYHPATNGLAERFVQTFKQAMKSMTGEKGSTSAKLANFLLAYRNAPHSTTGQSPATLFMGRNRRSRLDILKPNIRNHVSSKQVDQATSHNAASVTREFHIGQTVSVRDYRGKQKWIPGIIHARSGPLSYQVCVGPNMIWRRHADQLIDSDTGKPPDLNKPPDVVPEIPLPDPVVPASPSAHAKPEQAVPSQTPTRVEPPIQPSPPVVERRYPSRNRKPPDRLNL